ncbi:MAG: hypothetical protein ACRDY0_01510 [Acidimicrobiales bacterium]
MTAAVAGHQAAGEPLGYAVAPLAKPGRARRLHWRGAGGADPGQGERHGDGGLGERVAAVATPDDRQADHAGGVG